MKILIVESRDATRNKLARFFAGKACDINLVSSIVEVAEIQNDVIWDVLVISTQQQQLDQGCFCFVHNCKQAMPNIGVIMTTQAYSLEEKIKCYELGIDMYLIDPLTPEDLLLAIETCYKRKQRKALTIKPSIILSASSRTLSTDENTVRLTKNETVLLKSLVLAKDQQLETWQLLDLLGILDSEANHKHLSIIICRLHKKLKEHGFSDKMIRVIRNVGYRLTLPLSLK